MMLYSILTTKKYSINLSYKQIKKFHEFISTKKEAFYVTLKKC